MDAWTLVVVKGYTWNNELGEEELYCVVEKN
jgi:hypothetical protein